MVQCSLGSSLLGRNADAEAFAATDLARLVRLSPRQATVALLLARRLSNAEIAQALGLSMSTVRGHVEAVYMRLAVNHRRDVEPALRARLATPDGLARGVPLRARSASQQ
jgi:DNA-binding CsgD family transcriptional regulator